MQGPPTVTLDEAPEIVDAEGQSPEMQAVKTKHKKEKGKKGHKKEKIRKGEKPKSKKDIHINKESDAIAMLDKAFGGELGEIDTTTQFTKDEIKVDLTSL